MDLETLIRNHAAAMGGAEAIENVRAVQIELQIREATFDAEALYRADRAGRMRVDVSIDGVRVFSEGFDGKQGWQMRMNAGQGEPASAAGARALAVAAERQLLGLHELTGRGYTLELAGRETIEGVEYYAVEKVEQDGRAVRLYIDPDSWRIARQRERKALHPDVDAAESILETRFGDFRLLPGGAMRPFHETQVDLADGKLLQETVVKSVLVNPELEPGLFVCP